MLISKSSYYIHNLYFSIQYYLQYNINVICSNFKLELFINMQEVYFF